MSRNELVAKIEALNEWEAVIEEAKAEADALRDAIKAEMLAICTSLSLTLTTSMNRATFFRARKTLLTR